MIKLKYATAQSFGVSGMSYSYLYVSAVALQLPPWSVGQMFLHYNAGAGVWRDFPLPMHTSGIFNRAVGFAPNAPYCEEFVLKRIATDGAVEWDDNGGKNYRVTNFSAVVGGEVRLKEYLGKFRRDFGSGIGYWSISGTLYVANRGYRKKVGAIFSVDGWLTFQTASAEYIGPVRDGIYSLAGQPAELWKIELPEIAEDLIEDRYQFALYYVDVDTKVRYSDDNLGQNYQLYGAWTTE